MRRTSILALVILASVSAGCTTLGGMPVVTGSTGALEGREGAELQAAVVPGFHLSSATQEDPKGTPLPQGAGWLDAGEWVGAPGLAVGGRWVVSGDEEGYPEPMGRYRVSLDAPGRFALTGAVFGTRASGASQGASYQATRVGGEASINGRLTPRSHWIELHVFAGASVLALSAKGDYCVVPETGLGTDCNLDGTDTRVHGQVAGAYPAGFVGVGVDLARHLDSPFHGVRVEGMLSSGTMPKIRNGEQTSLVPFGAVGLALTVRAGSSESP